MCTVTFIPKSESDFILTSNRDEAPGRETFPPKIYHENSTNILYPRDAVAGGTWIGISEKNRVVTLMNGGFIAHKRKAFYARSRGLIVKDLLTTKDLKYYSKSYDFSEIEPFTVIAVEFFDNLRLIQMVWTGEKLDFSELPIKARIWSSSPLYPPDIANKRKTWFAEFLNKEKLKSADIIRFHQSAGEGDPMSDLIMDRVFVKTKSTTQIEKTDNSLTMHYHDFESDKKYHSSLKI